MNRGRMNTEETQQKEQKKTPKQILKEIIPQLIGGMILAYAIIVGPVLINSRTSSDPELEHTEYDSIANTCYAWTDQVNLYRNLRVFSKDRLNEVSVKLDGYKDSIGNLTARMCVCMARTSNQIEQVHTQSPLVICLSDSTFITLYAQKEGKVEHSQRVSRRSVARSWQYVYYPVTFAQMDTICNSEMMNLTIVAQGKAHHVAVRKKATKNLQKRYNLLRAFIIEHQSLKAEEAKISDTRTNDPSIALYARMNPAIISDSLLFCIKGYKDIEGDVSMILDAYFLYGDTPIDTIKTGNEMIIHFTNTSGLRITAFSDGYVGRRREGLGSLQYVNYKTTVSQMEARCLNEIQSITFQATGHTYRIKPRADASTQLQTRYQILREYLDSGK